MSKFTCAIFTLVFAVGLAVSEYSQPDATHAQLASDGTSWFAFRSIYERFFSCSKKFPTKSTTRRASTAPAGTTPAGTTPASIATTRPSGALDCPYAATAFSSYTRNGTICPALSTCKCDQSLTGQPQRGYPYPDDCFTDCAKLLNCTAFSSGEFNGDPVCIYSFDNPPVFSPKPSSFACVCQK